MSDLVFADFNEADALCCPSKKWMMKPLTNLDIQAITTYLETQDDFVLLDTARVDADNHHSFLFLNPCGWLSCPPGTDGSAFLSKVDEYRAAGYHLAGWFTYEFGYLLESRVHHLATQQASRKSALKSPPLALLGIFESSFSIDHLSSFDLDTLPWHSSPPVASSQNPAYSYSLNVQGPDISQATYLEAIARLKAYIEAGDTYQVNYTFKLDFTFSGSAAALYTALRRNQRVSYGAWVRCNGIDVMSFSPELFFHAEGAAVQVRPMKGTMKRGRSMLEDEEQRQQLCTDLKNRCENVMIVDLLRNDLGRMLHQEGGGEVETASLFDVETYETLFQMTSNVVGTGRAEAPLTLSQMMPALFPCGSVTGAPKIRTMEVIHELEVGSRGVYCGAIGYTSAKKTVFNVPIRTLVIEGEQGHMGIGSGVVYDSDGEAEWRECLLKGDFLQKTRSDFQLVETLLWQPGIGYRLLAFHLERLRSSAYYFLFPVDLDHVAQRLTQHQQKLSLEDPAHRVRLTLNSDGALTIHSTPLTTLGPEKLFQPICHVELPKVAFSPLKTDARDLFFFHKTTQRPVYDAAYAQAQAAGLLDLLFCNQAGYVTEGAIHNIFIQRDEEPDAPLLTPCLTQGVLAGTLRRYLLEWKRAVEQDFTLETLQQARAVYVGNSVRGLIQVEVVPLPGL